MLEKNLYLIDNFLIIRRKESTTVAKEQEILAAAKKAIIDYDVVKAEEVAREALANGINPVTVIEKGFTAGIAEVGDLFDMGEVYLPELILAADAMKAGTAICEAAFPKGTIKAKKKVVIGTVEGDIHDIGKNLVAIMMSGSGFEVIDLGIDVAMEKFLAAVEQHKPQILGLSALLTTTMLEMQKVIEAVRKSPLPEKPPVIVGGAAVTEAFAKEIGADGYGADAVAAVEVATKLLAGKG